jgi:hypothetical protein
VSGDEPAAEWKHGDTLGTHDLVNIRCTIKLAARDEVAWLQIWVEDPTMNEGTLLYWADDVTTNLFDAGQLLEQLVLVLKGAMGYLTPVI